MFNYGFELFVNLFQGVMFTVFCYKFLTPSRNKICEGIAFCVASLLMFLSITQINRLYVSFAYIETVVFFAIMIPYCVLFFKDRIFVKILTPVILNVIYSVLSFGINYIFSAIISCDYNYLMTESSQYRYMYVLMSNLIFVIVLFIIYNLFKNSLSHIHKQEIVITLVIPLLSIAVGLLTFLVSSNADMSDFDRIVLGAVSIILSFTFINFYLIKSLSKNYSLENENILLNKEKELYNVQMTSSEKYMKNLTDVKHNIQNQLLCIENLIDGQRYDEAKKMCNNVNNNISASVHFCKTGYVYLDAILNVVYEKAIENDIDFSVDCKDNLSFVAGDDLAVLIGNLADNAVEALAKEQNKKLKISIFQNGSYGVLNVQNYCSSSVLQTNPTLYTSKEDKKNHGRGISIVKSIAKKYGGDVIISDKNNEFTVTVILDDSYALTSVKETAKIQ